MVESVYDVVFRGRLVAGFEQAQVEQNLAKLFKIDLAKAQRLFSGQRVVLKKKVDRATADKYREVLKRAGAIVAAVSIKQAEPKPVEETVQEQAEPVAQMTEQVVDSGPGLAEPGVVLVAPTVIEQPDIDTSDLSLAAEGSRFEQLQNPPEPQIDLSGMSFEDDFDALDSQPKPSPPDYDLTQLTVSEPGEVLDHLTQVQTPDIDISHLEANDIVEPLDQNPKAAAPDIDFSELTIDDTEMQ